MEENNLPLITDWLFHKLISMQDVGCNMLHLKYRSTADITLSSCTSEVSSTKDKDAELYKVIGIKILDFVFQGA